jgi:hypothetical protein
MNAVKVKKGEIEVGLDIDPEKGAADSGDLESCGAADSAVWLVDD